MIHTVFFGTHNLAVTVLQVLIDDPNISVDLVITQPDRPVGRKKVLTPPPVKVLAEKYDIEVQQPTSLKKFRIQNSHPSDTSVPLKFRIATLTEYGVMVPQSLIDQFDKGILNVHYSLLPKYRGATPIQSAIRSGDTETGVSIMLLEKSMDTGPVVAKATHTLGQDDMHEDVNAALAKLGGELLVESLPKYLDGTLTPEAQDDDAATYCSQLTRDDGRVDWNESATNIYNQYRAYSPWPGVWTMWGDKRVKLLELSAVDEGVSAGKITVDGDTLLVGTTDGSIQVHRLQLEGKKEMEASTFLQGNNMQDEEFVS